MAFSVEPKLAFSTGLLKAIFAGRYQGLSFGARTRAGMIAVP